MTSARSRVNRASGVSERRILWILLQRRKTGPDGCSDVGQRQGRPQGYERRTLATQMCCQHVLDHLGSDIEDNLRNITVPLGRVDL